MCVNKTFNDSTNSHDPQGRPPPTPLLTLLNVIIPSKTNPFLLTSCRLANGQVGGHFCENHTYISREIPAGQLDNAREKILMRLNSSLPTTPLSLLVVWTPQENTLYSSINVHNHGSSSKKIDHAMAQTPPFLKCYWFQFKYWWMSVFTFSCLFYGFEMMRSNDGSDCGPSQACINFSVTQHEIYLKTCVTSLASIQLQFCTFFCNDMSFACETLVNLRWANLYVCACSTSRYLF